MIPRHCQDLGDNGNEANIVSSGNYPGMASVVRAVVGLHTSNWSEAEQ